MTEFASFDVFDTVLVRGATDPTNLFLVVGRRLKKIGLELSPAAFRACRVAAERRCRENCAVEEVTLTEIYRELAFDLGLDPVLCRSVEQLELEAEAETLSVNPRVREMITAARASGRRIVFVSDMYLPADFIRAQLKRHGLMADGDGCYVSSERRETKSSGRLFQHLLAEEKVEAKSVVHVGDNPHSDDACPRKLGIISRPHTDARPNRYEQAMESFAVETDGLSSRFAGAARSARLEGPQQGERDIVLWEAGTGVAGPILSAYVLWVLDNVRKAGVERLYFLSRDGYILQRLAERLAPAMGISVELRYLCGSRQAWHLPAVKSLGREHLGWLMDATYRMSVRQVLARVEVEPKEIETDLKDGGFPPAQWDTPIALDRLPQLAEVLLRPSVAAVVAVRAEARREVVVAYLRQEGLLDGARWSLVDIGWNGRLQASLASLIGSAQPHSLNGYYFALVRRPADAGELRTYFFDRMAGLGLPNARLSPTMMEMFCTAAHGTTVGYSEQGNRIEPIFSPTGERMREWGVEVVHQAILAFGNRLARAVADRPAHADLRPMIAELIRTWWLQPEVGHAKVWGSFPFEDDQAGGDCQPVASPYSWTECLQACRRRGIWFQRSNTEWQPACVVLTSRTKRLLVGLARGGWDALLPVRRLIRQWLPRR